MGRGNQGKTLGQLEFLWFHWKELGYSAIINSHSPPPNMSLIIWGIVWRTSLPHLLEMYTVFLNFFFMFLPFFNVRKSFVLSEFKEFDEVSEVFTSEKSAEVCPYPFFPCTYLSPQLSGAKLGKLGKGDNKFKQGLGKERKKPHEVQGFHFLLPGEMNANGSEFWSCTPENYS